MHDRVAALNEGDSLCVDIKITSVFRAGPMENAGYPNGISMLGIPSDHFNLTRQIARSPHANRVISVRNV